MKKDREQEKAINIILVARDRWCMEPLRKTSEGSHSDVKMINGETSSLQISESYSVSDLSQNTLI